jgi:type II secretory pathway pseudopilin PulG
MNDMLKKYTVKKSVVQQGFIIPALLALIITFGTLMIVVSGVISNTLGSAARNQSSQVAINIAEAGINYYLWHMSHNSGDYKDGTTAAQTPDSVLGYGPYVHDYKDSTGAKRGTFTLYIKPGENGSNVTTVRSEAKQVGAASIERVVVAELGAPSFSAYAVASNSELWFGSTETAMAPCTRTSGLKWTAQITVS